MRLIVGLGNPGLEYDWTPHNLGFLAIDAIAASAGIRVMRPEAQSYAGLGRLAGEEVVLAKPQTFMNRSGPAVRILLEKYELAPADLIVLIDEVDLPWGMIRIRERGRNSSHNGIKSIISSLQTDEFIRVRLGVQPQQMWGDRKDYVLARLGREERKLAEEMCGEAVVVVETILKEGVQQAMTKFNHRVTGAGEES